MTTEMRTHSFAFVGLIKQLFEEQLFDFEEQLFEKGLRELNITPLNICMTVLVYHCFPNRSTSVLLCKCTVYVS